MANYHEYSHQEVTDADSVGVGTGDAGDGVRVCVYLTGDPINGHLADDTKRANWVSLTPGCAQELYDQLVLVKHLWEPEESNMNCICEYDECIEAGFCLTERREGPHLLSWNHSPSFYLPMCKPSCKRHSHWTGVCHDCTSSFPPDEMKVVCTDKGTGATVCNECFNSKSRQPTDSLFSIANG